MSCASTRGPGRGAASLIDENATIGDLQAQGRFGPDFFRHYLLPMSSAIWSAAACDAVRLPLAFLLEFFDNHGLLQVRGQPPWRTVTGGSRRYVEALIRPFEDRVRLHAAVDRLRRDGGGVEVHTRDMGWERYDEAVVATHADQALALIEQPDDEEREALGAIPLPPQCRDPAYRQPRPSPRRRGVGRPGTRTWRIAAIVARRCG